MTSNFLGDVHTERHISSIISANELVAREGLDLHKGMNFRDKGPQLSVFLVLEREDGYRDEWNFKTRQYVYQGHDSTTVEEGKSVDQLLMYSDGRLTDNGKFFKAAHAYKDELRNEPLQVQVYEKLDPGVWYDKGIFNLVDAKQVVEGGRKVCKFHCILADDDFYSADDPDTIERLLPAAIKAEIWARDKGRCVLCRSEMGLRFVANESRGAIRIFCEEHSGRKKKGLLG